MSSLASEGSRDAIGAHTGTQAKHLYNIKIIKILKWVKRLIRVINRNNNNNKENFKKC